MSERQIWLRRCASLEKEGRADPEIWRTMTGEERVAVVEELRWLHAKEHGIPYGKIELVARITDLHHGE